MESFLGTQKQKQKNNSDLMYLNSIKCLLLFYCTIPLIMWRSKNKTLWQKVFFHCQAFRYLLNVWIFCCASNKLLWNQEKEARNSQTHTIFQLNSLAFKYEFSIQKEYQTEYSSLKQNYLKRNRRTKSN